MSVGQTLLRFARPAVVRVAPAATAYRSYRHMQEIRRTQMEPKKTPMGFRLLGNETMERGEFEPTETKLVNRLLEKVDVFINVGANIGYYCCWALMRGKHVVAFEPVEMNLRYLYRNVRANAWENNIEIFPVALTDRTGLMELYGANGGGRTTGSLVEGWAGAAMDDVSIVPVSTMDILLESRFPGQQCLVLADVEGAEKTMLDGAEKFLKREPKPIWMVEISSRIVAKSGDHIINPHLISTFQIFWNQGYEAWTADEKVRLVTAAEVEAVVKTGQDLSTHNFLFMPRGKRQEIFGAVSGI